MSLIIVHLSDIHIKTDKDGILSKVESLADVVRSYQNKKDSCAIVVSGDIAFSGNKSQYLLAASFFNGVIDRTKGCFSRDVSFVFAPGNHDCDFSDNPVRDVLIDSLKSLEPESNVKSAIIDQCIAVQDEYFNFRDAFRDGLVEENKLWSKYIFNFEGKSVCFESLNFSWSSQISEQQGGLIYPPSLFNGKAEESFDLRIFVFHHPLNWFKQGQYQSLRSKVRNLSDITLSGHEHVDSVSSTDDAREGTSVLIEGCCFQETGDSSFSEFGVLSIDLNEYVFSYEKYSFHDEKYVKVDTNLARKIFSKTSVNNSNKIKLKDEFIVWLTDPGANFSHPYKNKLLLSDIFVYPDIEEFSTSIESEGYFKSSVLLNYIEEEEKVFIKGCEKSGKTSLVKSLYFLFYENGYYPLFIDASKINRVASKDLGKLYDEVISDQYGIDSSQEYKSLSRESRVVFIDGFDKARVSDRYQIKVLEYFSDLFDKIIVTADDLMDVGEILISESTEVLSDFKHYKIRHFGNKLRYELIKKWRSLGDDYNLSQKELLVRVDSAEKTLNSVIGKNLVPKIPIYILTILQSLESGNKSDFHNGGLGHYYHYLITEALGKVKVSLEELDEFFGYLGQLSWFFYSHPTPDYVARSDIEKFTDVYSEEYTKISCDERIRILVDARVLIENGGGLSFCYPYIYYYFLGQYIAQNIVGNEEIQGVVSKCCNHLYMKEYSNIILFTIHHTKDRDLVSDIISNLKNIFDEHLPISFDGDTESISKFVGDTASMVYQELNPDDVRMEKSEFKDKIEDKLDTLDVKERECENELDILSKMNKMFKIIDILGQMLKSYYGTIRNSDKKDYMFEIFNAPLRALRDFYLFLETNNDTLVIEIEEYLRSKNGDLDPAERKKLAEMFSYEIVGMVTTSFIMKPAASVASTNLRSVIHDVIDENSTTAFKLIKVASDLELPGLIPFDQISDLSKSTNGDMFARRVLQTIVLNHLYLFKVSEPDKQRVCSILDIEIKKQRQIEFNNKGSKIK
ncbi:3',5'-cyclic AMP phosphodiesterase CpdA [Amphritea atlantica]|uniref:3',5'-cyclic AMP phosphodiesterase CpdA n=1 Tax=Amphritea atlantica TaxID=355243 RepID=A0A1H9L0R6_9GAMM|nr:metallophosphoesterase [Amphritea atlantica]SER04765.1 3',5'-cyclic AMP phosphodiesterase CpdA [Amphritea atlantica]